MNLKHSHRHYFNEKAADWDDPSDGEKREHVVKIFQQYNIQPRGKILDVGCGTGILIPVLSHILSSDSPLFELDFSEKMLRKNQKNRRIDDAKHISLVLADAHHLPFRKMTFQWIIAFAVFPHLSDGKKVLTEWSRILSRGGSLVILHLMGSRELNHLHSQSQGAITHDHLPPADQLSRIIDPYEFEVNTAVDCEDLYLIHAVKQ